MKIGICIPTRGIVTTLCIESVLRNVQDTDFEYEFYFTHDMPLPDSRIDITNRALDDGVDYLWWVDDDVVIPDGFLKKLVLSANKKTIATGAYFMQNGKTSVHYEKDGRATQCGFGCALIHRDIYKHTPEPWYLVSKCKIYNGNTASWIDDPNNAWGGEDLWFYHQAIDVAGFKIKDCGMVGHLRIHTWGNKYLNKGMHEIYFLDENGQRDMPPSSMTDDEWFNQEKEYIDTKISEMKEAHEN